MLINADILGSYTIIVDIANNKAFAIYYKNTVISLKIKIKLNHIISRFIYNKNSLIISIYS